MQFLTFDEMLTPRLIILLYWILLLSAVATGLNRMFAGFGGFNFGGFLTGIAIMAGGALAARVWCELLIVLFKMNEALQEIRKK
ncbi:MAG: DUF4282 domain-containing protein [Sulfuriferula sp.]